MSWLSLSQNRPTVMSCIILLQSHQYLNIYNKNHYSYSMHNCALLEQFHRFGCAAPLAALKDSVGVARPEFGCDMGAVNVGRDEAE